jgi:hypothetical protein
VPQLGQGFLHPQALLGTGKPQRLQVSGAGALWADGRRAGGAVDAVPRSSPFDRISTGDAAPLPRCPAALPKPIRSGQERIGQPLDADGGIEPMPAMNYS